MYRILLFHIHFSQIRYQIKANTPTHMAKYTELFLFLPFLNKSIFFLVRRNFFERVYLQNIALQSLCPLSPCPTEKKQFSFLEQMTILTELSLAIEHFFFFS